MAQQQALEKFDQEIREFSDFLDKQSPYIQSDLPEINYRKDVSNI